MLQISDIRKEYRTGTLVQKALDGVSVNFRDNEFVAVLGPSGSGKTTLLNIIGGLDRYDSGDLIINGISTKQYKDRDWDSYRNHTIGFVFQSYNLIPHQSVLSNVELALTISGISKKERRARAMEALQKVGLGDQVHKIPAQMSGGQMQRVAIARALVNDPDILLADEPTGALDSDTSIQVMDLLREVASDRLVVMVTHNPELAAQYATRIVNLRDGRIISDSDPFEAGEAGEPPVRKNMGKSSMSFFTALQLSFNNLLTKKARTILVAFAGSIGIIGIALILAMSNGANNYIADIEKDTLSEYPVEITSSAFSLMSMMDPGTYENEDKDRVTEIRTITRMLSTMKSNDLASLKEYIDSGESGIGKYARSIEYDYSVTPLVYSPDTDKIRQVNPYSVLAAFDSGLTSLYSSFSSFSMSMTNLFHEMPEDPSLYENQYDVKAGRWPENYNECIIVLTEHGYVSDLALFAMGLQDDSDLERVVKEYMSGGVIGYLEEDDEPAQYDYEDFTGIKFKLVNACDCYTYDPQYGVWTNRTDNEEYMRALIDSSEELTIVGVVIQSEDSNSSMLSTGINYPYDLTRHIIETAAASDIVRAQLEDPATDVLTGTPFGEKSSGTFDFASIFSIDEEALRNAFSVSSDLEGLSLPGDILKGFSAGGIDPEVFKNIDPGSLDLSGIDLGSLADTEDLASMFPDIAGIDSAALSEIFPDISELEGFDLSQLLAAVAGSEGSGLSDILSDISDTGDIDPARLFSGLEESLPDIMPEFSREDILELIKDIDIDLDQDDIRSTVSELAEGFTAYTKDDPSADISALSGALADYLATEEAGKIVRSGIRSLVDALTDEVVTREDLQELSDSISDGFDPWLKEKGYEDVENYARYVTEYLASETVLDMLKAGVAGMFGKVSENVRDSDLNDIAKQLSDSYSTYAAENSLPSPDGIINAFNSYLTSDEAAEIINKNIISKINTDALREQIGKKMSDMISSVSGAMEEKIAEAMKDYGEKISSAVSEYIESAAAGGDEGNADADGSVFSKYGDALNEALSEYGKAINDAIASDLGEALKNASEQMLPQLEAAISGYMSSAVSRYMEAAMSSVGSLYNADDMFNASDLFSFDENIFKDAFSLNSSETDIKDMLSSMFSNTVSSYDQNLENLGYADLAKPDEILIYPNDFASKNSITDILKEYNADMAAAGEEEKVITYTDMVGTLMSSVTIIVDAISYVLIAFVSISLVVSSIMIGVITYISVLERRKEIGILRSIGASKHNISSVFNAETIITGLLAGIMGTGISLLLIIPINIILRTLTGQANLGADLPPAAVVILIALSVFLTLMGGLIPSRKAANSDPVAALRNE